MALRILVARGWVLVAGQAAHRHCFLSLCPHPTLALGLGFLALGAALNTLISRFWRRDRCRSGLGFQSRGGGYFGALYGAGGGFPHGHGRVLNSYVILLLAPVSVSATALSRRLTASLVILAIALISVLTVASLDLPVAQTAQGWSIC